MDTEEVFLKAVIADPDDDAPRLIFADWLDEQGQGERAEFIKLQVELALGGGECRCTPMSELIWGPCSGCRRLKRETELRDIGINGFLTAQTHPLGLPSGVEVIWHRGFIEEINDIPAEDWLRHAGRVYDSSQPETWQPGTIFSSQPVRKVVWTTLLDDDTMIELGAAVLHRRPSSLWTFDRWPGIEFSLPRYGSSFLRDGYITWRQMVEAMDRRDAARQPFLIGRI